MKAILFLGTSFLILCAAFSHGKAAKNVNDTTNSVRINGKVLIANAGFAPIPAFSFNSPIAIGFLTIKKKGFSYEPDFALGLNGKPWMANNWFRMTLRDRKKVKLNAGINPSLFFKTEWTAAGEKILNAQRNLSFEIGGTRKFSKNSSLTLAYMHVHAFDIGALSGNFFDVSSSFPVISTSKIISITLKPELFYFDFKGNVDGFFASTRINIEHRQIPVSIYYQGVLPLWTDFSGNSFKWNMGVVYAF